MGGCKKLQYTIRRGLKRRRLAREIIEMLIQAPHQIPKIGDAHGSSTLSAKWAI
jgi:hypothetical protein